MTKPDPKEPMTVDEIRSALTGPAEELNELMSVAVSDDEKAENEWKLAVIRLAFKCSNSLRPIGYWKYRLYAVVPKEDNESDQDYYVEVRAVPAGGVIANIAGESATCFADDLDEILETFDSYLLVEER